MSENIISIVNTQAHHADAVAKVVCAAYHVPPEECDGCKYTLKATDILAHIRQFPEGQFVALLDGRVVGMAATMRTNRPPSGNALPWLEAIGGLSASNHDPNGEWLYGVEVAVHPDCRGRGIGVRLYEARFNLIQRLNLRGWYAGGMLMGYHRYKDQMSVPEYAEKVARREITDPTVTMQMNRGFRVGGVIENYLEEHFAGNGAMLIIWDNPAYEPIAEKNIVLG